MLQKFVKAIHKVTPILRVAMQKHIWVDQYNPPYHSSEMQVEFLAEVNPELGLGAISKELKLGGWTVNSSGRTLVCKSPKGRKTYAMTLSTNRKLGSIHEVGKKRGNHLVNPLKEAAFITSIKRILKSKRN